MTNRMSISPEVVAAPLLRDRALLALLSLAMLVPGTIGISLFDRDEGWYAQVSREMVESGDWVVPTYLGEPWIAKPPLLYWCVAGAFRVLGRSEFSARLVSVLALTGAMQLLYTLGARMLSRRAGLLGAAACITAILPATVGKLLLTDALLFFLIAAAMERAWSIAANGATAARSAAFWAIVGLAILCKGPAIGPFVAAFMLGLWWVSRSPDSPVRRGFLGMRFWAFAPLALLIAAPWYVAVSLREGATLWQQFLGFEIGARLVGTPHGHGGWPGYHLLVLLGGWFPWSILVPGAVFEAVAERRRKPVLTCLLIAFALPWLFLEIVPSKLPHYALPCFLPLGLLIGRMWDVGLSRAMIPAQKRVLRTWAISGIAVGATVACTPFYLNLPRAPLIACGGSIILGFVLVMIAMVRDLRQWLVPLIAGSTLVAHTMLNRWLLPELEPQRLSRNIAVAANELYESGAKVVTCGYEEPSMYFNLHAAARETPRESMFQAVQQSAPGTVLILQEPLAGGVAGFLSETPRIVEGWNMVRGKSVRVRVALRNKAN